MKKRLKKLINHVDRVAVDAVEGLALAFPHLLRQIKGISAVVRRDAPVAGKVAVIVGGGSGHEPMFLGYVGPGLASGGVAGNVFASPPPRPIVLTAKAAHGNSGVLFLYGNYAGDVLNFDAAAEMLEDEDIRVMSVRVTDDVASAPVEEKHRRRGVAGDLFVFKVAGARAEERGTLTEVAAVAQKANDHTRSMGVALTSCTIPASGKAIFDLPEDEIEMGLGLHGEPGQTRTKLLPADQIARQLVSRIVADLSPRHGDEVAVLLNGLGATPVCELFIMFREVKECLDSLGLSICRSYVGNYATSLDMAGCSVSIMKLDSELKRLLLAPANSPAFVQI